MRLKSPRPLVSSRPARWREEVANPDAQADVPAEAEAPAGSAVVGGLQRKSMSLLISVFIHCLLVVALGLFTLSYGPAAELPGDVIQIGELPAEVLDSSESEFEELDAASAAKIESDLDETELTVTDPTNDVEQLTIDSPSIMSLGGSGEISTQGMGSLSGSGASGQASFMGVQAYGRRFCIIADRSGSMAGRPLAHVKLEAGKTIDTMTSGSSIHLVFYSNHWTAYPKEWGMAKEIRDEAHEWLDSVKSKGGTQPATSFHHAFALTPPPDAIFFMTDGKIPGNIDKVVANLNARRQKKIPVHTIAFMNRAAAPLLERIAEQSGGSFRFVAGF